MGANTSRMPSSLCPLSAIIHSPWRNSTYIRRNHAAAGKRNKVVRVKRARHSVPRIRALVANVLLQADQVKKHLCVLLSEKASLHSLMPLQCSISTVDFPKGEHQCNSPTAKWHASSASAECQSTGISHPTAHTTAAPPCSSPARPTCPTSRRAPAANCTCGC